MSVLAAAAGAPWSALTALPRLALAAARLRRARAARTKAPLPVACLTDAEAREADYALVEAAQTVEARARADARRNAAPQPSLCALTQPCSLMLWRHRMRR
jgi:hypothetical protein